MSQQGYIDYFEVLGLPADCKQGEVRNQYKRHMRDLVMEIQRVEITADRRERYLLELAKVNAAFYILRNNALREQYVADRAKVIELEEKWGRQSRLEARRQTTCAAPSMWRFATSFRATWKNWCCWPAATRNASKRATGTPAHERHAGRVLRHYRQELYQTIHERLPYYDVTQPTTDLDERERTARARSSPREPTKPWPRTSPPTASSRRSSFIPVSPRSLPMATP